MMAARVSRFDCRYAMTAAGSGIWAPAVFTTSNAPQKPSPIARVARSFVIYITVGVRRL
jgi:hypothetical protein